jgi:hypothetical protein
MAKLESMELALSTLAVEVVAEPTRLFERWSACGLASQAAIATDPRLPLPLQRALLELARRRGAIAAELAHPGLDSRGRATPRLTAPDREERRAARDLLLGTLTLAAEVEAQRVVLLPELLSLHQEIATLRRRFARAEALRLEPLRQERGSCAEEALDRLRGALEPALHLADREGLTLNVLGPAVWPQQLPDAQEIAALQREFGGAPLGWQHATDWRHARETLDALEHEPDQDGLAFRSAVDRQSGQPELPPEMLALLPDEAVHALVAPPAEAATAPAPPSCLRIADACGLELRLPPGTGLLFGQPRDGESLALAGVDQIDQLTLACEGTPAELQRGAALAEEAIDAVMAREAAD